MVAILAYFLVEFAAAVRWNILLKVQKIHLSMSRVSGLFLIGMFYNQFLPGGTGGDIIKSYLLLKETPGKATGAYLRSYLIGSSASLRSFPSRALWSRCAIIG